MKPVLFIASLALATAGTAAAQPGLTPPGSPPSQAAQPTAPAPPAQPQETVSEGVALGLSFGGTAAAWAMILEQVHLSSQGNGSRDLALLGVAGVLVGPSLGHWYAHSFATRGLGLRLGGVAALTLALGMAIAQCEDECDDTAYKTTALVGLGLVIAGTIDDIVTAPSEAHRYNQRSQRMSLIPMVRRDTGGLMIAGRF